MKDIAFYIKFKMFDYNPKIIVREDGKDEERIVPTKMNTILEDLFKLTQEYSGRVRMIHMYGASPYALHYYTKIKTKFNNSDILIELN